LQIVAVAAGLFEDMARDQFLALDLAFERLEFAPGDFCSHAPSLTVRAVQQNSTAEPAGSHLPRALTLIAPSP